VGQRIATRGFAGLRRKARAAKKALAVTKVPLVTLAQQSD
jgi:hypothetical protein